MQLRKDGTILPRHGNHQAANDPRHPAQLIEHDAIRNNHYQPTHPNELWRESPAMQVVRDGPVVNRPNPTLLADGFTPIANAVDRSARRLRWSGGNTPAIFLPRTVALDLPKQVTIWLMNAGLMQVQPTQC
jgi:hypothetical protein